MARIVTHAPATKGPTATTIGILHLGELGQAFATRLRERHRVVTSTDARSAATLDRAFDAGIEVLAGVDEVVDAADLIISLVSPQAAVEVAERCASRSGSSTLYLDANSISIEAGSRVAEVVGQAGFRYVGGGVRGGAHRLDTDGVVYLSGADAAEVAELIEPSLRVRILGDDPALAKALKLLVGGVSKGANLLFLELAAAANQLELLEEFEAEIADFYPHLAAWFDRFVPTFVPHAERRRSEMADLARLVHRAGVEPAMIRAAQDDLTEIVGRGESDDAALVRTLTLLSDRSKRSSGT